MGGFFKKVGDTAAKAKKSVDDSMEISKFQKQISEQEGAIRSAYQKIGELVYKNKKDPEVPVDDEILEFCNTIDACLQNIETAKDKILDVKNIVICPKCGTQVPKGTKFCSSCGEKLPEEVRVEEAPVEGEVVEKKCIECGQAIADGTVFCPNCGKKQE